MGGDQSRSELNLSPESVQFTSVRNPYSSTSWFKRLYTMLCTTKSAFCR